MGKIELEEILVAQNYPRFRAKQIMDWLYQKQVASFQEMRNLPKLMRLELEENFSIEHGTVISALHSKDEKTIKSLLAFTDGEMVETVLMKQPYGNSVCVSTQVGCNMGCSFCASTLLGMKRNLTAAEMLAEVIYNQKLLKNAKVTNVVLMGSGEPLLNYEAVLQFLHMLHDADMLNIGYRNITISTSGIVPMIRRLAKEALQITLSLSLHAPNNELRSQLMPINRKYSLDELFPALDEYVQLTKRRITYEYILIDRINDTRECAEELAHLLKNRLANVNLIPINPVKERGYKRPSLGRVQEFLHDLQRKGINATIRKEMGADINAACGQLRNRKQLLYKEEEA